MPWPHVATRLFGSRILSRYSVSIPLDPEGSWGLSQPPDMANMAGKMKFKICNWVIVPVRNAEISENRQNHQPDCSWVTIIHPFISTTTFGGRYPKFQLFIPLLIVGGTFPCSWVGIHINYLNFKAAGGHNTTWHSTTQHKLTHPSMSPACFSQVASSVQQGQWNSSSESWSWLGQNLTETPICGRYICNYR